MDVITMGRTQLVFVPFCGSEFDWAELSSRRTDPPQFAFDHASRATKGARDYQEYTRILAAEAVPPADVTTPTASRLVAVLADGMGGHTAGALASRMVCDSLHLRSTRASTARGRSAAEVAHLGQRCPSPRKSRQPDAVGHGHDARRRVFGNEGVEWVSVGDSPLLLYPRGEIALLNEDHSLAPELDRLAARAMSHEQAARPAPAHAAFGRDRR